MQEPSVRTSRLAIAAGLAAAVAVGGIGFVLGRNTAPAPQAPPVVTPAPAATPSPRATASPEAARVLGRADLIALAQDASEALAAGRVAPDRVAQAFGRRFSLALPFGCAGSSDGASSWRYDAEAQTLRVSVRPMQWPAQEWAVPAPGEPVVAEGFWLTRPWSAAEACPSTQAPAVPASREPVTLPGQTLAVAQFFTGSENRDARRDGRPFEIVKRVAPDQFNGASGFVLRVTGRIDRVPGAGPVRCVQPAGIDQRPICVVAIRMDEVAIENPATAEVLASWPIGRPG